MQGLGGLAPGLNRGATMSGNKAGGLADVNPVKLLRVGKSTADVSISFLAEIPGLYQFALYSNGGNGSPNLGGGGGSLAIKTKRLRKSEVATILLAYNAASTVTFDDGSVLTAGRGGNTNPGVSVGAGGVATGGDVNLSGTSGSASGAAYLGGSAPSYLGFVGGQSADTPVLGNATPGGGGTGFAQQAGCPGQIIVTYVGS